MKIVYDHQIFSWQKYGGISRYLSELAVQISSLKGHSVNVLSPFYVNEYIKIAPKHLCIWGFHIIQIPKTGRLLRAINYFIVWPIVRFLKPEIFHETYYSSRRVAPRTSKVVLTVYDMIHERYSDQFSALDSTERDKATAVARADHIICISEQTRKDLINTLGTNPNKISVVYLGFSLSCQPNDIKKLSDFKQPFLLYVGARGGYKNFDSFIKAYAKSEFLRSNFNLVCFGGGAFTSRELAMIQELNINDSNVRQVSGSDEVLGGYYEAASVFVYPSFYEGFGIPPLEAMSFGCPVVCSNASSIPEVVGEAAVMFDPHDVQSIKLAIEQVVKDKDLQRKLIGLGKERIKHFSWERCAQETLKVYHKVLS